MSKAVGVALAALALAGCASLDSLTSEVSSHSLWPAGRLPGTYSFERLPSQQERAAQQQLLEDAARPALEAAGFAPADAAAKADVTVQLGARITAADRTPFDDPFWWGPGIDRPHATLPGGRLWIGSGWHPGATWGWRYGWGPGVARSYEREAALLIRDRQSGQVMYESRAVSEGFAPMVASALPAMFAAAMSRFPAGNPTPVRVTVPAPAARPTPAAAPAAARQ